MPAQTNFTPLLIILIVIVGLALAVGLLLHDTELANPAIQQGQAGIMVTRAAIEAQATLAAFYSTSQAQENQQNLEIFQTAQAFQAAQTSQAIPIQATQTAQAIILQATAVPQQMTAAAAMAQATAETQQLEATRIANDNQIIATAQSIQAAQTAAATQNQAVRNENLAQTILQIAFAAIILISGLIAAYLLLTQIRTRANNVEITRLREEQNLAETRRRIAEAQNWFLAQTIAQTRPPQSPPSQTPPPQSPQPVPESGPSGPSGSTNGHTDGRTNGHTNTPPRSDSDHGPTFE